MSIKLPNLCSLDRDEKFLSGKCLLYVGRLLSINHNFDDELLTFLAWLLGPRVNCLRDAILKYANSATRKETFEALAEAGNDCRENGAVLFDGMKKISPVHLGKIRKTVISLIDEEYRNLTYRGLSTTEKNLNSLQTMFSLKHSELEFVTFLLTLASTEKADDYFDTHFSIFNYAGRKYLAAILGVDKSEIPKIINGKLKDIALYDHRHESFEIEQHYLDLLQNNTSKNIARNLFSPAPSGSIPLGCHFIDPEQIACLLDILQSKPVNSSSHILLYGPPGTGKTSFALGVAEQISAPTYLLKQ
ncbi:ATP-binding protein, partial [bacterium]|nr:ATP-binding protein [bacterium]